MDFCKFEDLPLKVPSLKILTKKYGNLTLDLKWARTPEDAIKVVKKAFKLQDDYRTELTVISIRYSIDTNNKQYERANRICDEITPKITELEFHFHNEILKHKFAEEIKAKFGETLFKIYENDKLCFEPKIVDDMVEVNRLSNEYSALIASAQVEFNGEICNLSQLGKHMTSVDRDTRIAAAKAYYGFLSENDEKIGEIYDKLVHLRDGMAKKLGYENFVELGYKMLGRLDYNAEMVKGYRDQIYREVVPVVAKLKKAQMKHIGIKNPLFVDYNLTFAEGNPKPVGDINQLAKSASNMYHEMSEETGAYFDKMYDNGYMDLETKKGKMGGGYMTTIPKVGMSFIFANSNGTSQDVDTLTHEFGHAYQGYLGNKIKVPELRSPTLEACEIDSMSMEFFAHNWIDKFFGEDAKKYQYMHLADALAFLPYGAAIDEFQHFVYENPDVSHKERCAKWAEIDKKYRPWMNYEGFEYLENGGLWVRQGHIFNSPFYYIDYTLAQVIAFQFKVEMNKDWNKAFKKYIKLLKLGGTLPFLSLLEKAKLRNPFEEGNIKKVVKPLVKELAELEKEVYAD